MNKRAAVFVIFTVITLVTLASEAFAAPTKYSLRGARLATITVGGQTLYCGLLPNRRTGFVPVKSVGNGRFVEVSRNRNRTWTNRCKFARGGSSSNGISLTQLPSSNTIVSTRAGGNSISTVSGTPPLIGDLRSADITSVFWRSGIVSAIASGTPTSDQCSEFWGSASADGVSSGFSGCYLAQNVGEALQNVLQSGTNLCYMRSVPTESNLSSGLLRLNSGSLPAGGISSIFTTPTGTSSRLVRMAASSGEGTSKIYLRIYSSGENSASGDQYRANLWFCDPGQDSPQEVVSMRFLATEQFSVTSWNHSAEDRPAASLSTVAGFLRRSGGDYVFDDSRSRSVENTYITDDDSQHSGVSLTVSSDNIIRSKSWFISGSTENRKSYSLMRFTGSSATSLRFEAGAYKDSFIRDSQVFSNTIGTEFRTSTYLTAPAVSLVSELADVDLGTDSFFASTPSISFDLTPFSCSATPDVEINLNMSHPSMAAIQQACEGEQLRDMNFCNADSTLQTAQSRWFSVCSL